MKKHKTAYRISYELISLIDKCLHYQKTLINDVNDYYWDKRSNLNPEDLDGHKALESDFQHLYELIGMNNIASCEIQKIISGNNYFEGCDG